MRPTRESTDRRTGRKHHLPRRQFLAALLLCGLTACAGTSSQTAVPMTRDRVIEDVNFAVAAMAEIHPNLHWRTTAAEIERKRQQLIAALPEKPTAVDVYVTLRRLTAVVNDAHVAVTDVPDDLRGGDGQSLAAQYFKGGGDLPVDLNPAADGLQVVGHTTSKSLRSGDLIEGVNGVPAADIVARLEEMMPGGAQTKHRGARLEFGRMLWLIGIHAPFNLKIRSAGAAAARQVTIPGSQPFAPASVVERFEVAIEYRLLADRIGLISFHDMTEEPQAFVRRIIMIYGQILKDRPRGLIVDIRDNPGGNSLLGEILLTLVTDRAYRPFSERQWKVSQACKNYFRRLGREDTFKQFARYQEEPVGKLLIDPVTVATARPPKFAFKGPVAALIGPDTFSSAEFLADAMKTYDLVTLFGQPTGEPANQFGEVCHAVLPNSGITVAAPSARFTRADGNADTADPVFPHHLVQESPPTRGSDPALDAARRWIAAQAPTAATAQ